MKHSMANMKQCRDEYLADANEAMDKWFAAVSPNLSVEAKDKIRAGRVDKITRNKLLTDFEKTLAYRRIIRQLEEEVTHFEKTKSLD